MPSGSARFETALVTQTPADDARDSLLPFRVVRQPSSSQLRRLIREAGVHVAGAATLPVISALLAGKPVVGEHHGFPTICPTGQLFQFPRSIPCPGHFIRAGDSADLAVQIERILDDPALSKRFACTAHRRVIDVFTEEGMIEGHARIYERLLPVRPA